VKSDLGDCVSEVLELSCLAWAWVTPTFDLVAKEMPEQVA
jgi:hypothetical protein